MLPDKRFGLVYIWRKSGGFKSAGQNLDVYWSSALKSRAQRHCYIVQNRSLAQKTRQNKDQFRPGVQHFGDHVSAKILSLRQSVAGRWQVLGTSNVKPWINVQIAAPSASNPKSRAICNLRRAI